MKFSFSWLKTHLNTTATAQQVAEKLVTLGIEVESLTHQAAAFNRVVIGHVLSRTPHPDADKLGVCLVNVGEATPRQIVCGAANVRAGLVVAVALDGACLPGDFIIGRSKIRGVESNGMICSERELGLGTDHNGIMELGVSHAPGTAFATAMGLDEVLFDVSITPNRGDALSVYGLARDLAAAGIGTLNPLLPPAAPQGAVPPAIMPSSTTPDCPYFAALHIRGLTNTKSPAWLVQRLESAGLRSRNAVVDVTNFILMDIGQPLHAYNAEKITGSKIWAAKAAGGEVFKGVVGDDTYTLHPDDTVIMDASGVIGLAGVLGGASTAVDDTTTEVYLEAAWFNRQTIARTGQRHKINSDARHRFERGIDPAATPVALAVAGALITRICGGEMSAMASFGNNLKNMPEILFDSQKMASFCGVDVPTGTCHNILLNLGFQVEKAQGSVLRVTPPSYRTYMETPEDVAEEVLRVYGFHTVEAVVPPIPLQPTLPLPQGLKIDRFARRQLAAMGFTETLNYSFINHEKAQLFAADMPLLRLQNPIDEAEMSTMRPSLLPGLIDAALRNAARNQHQLCLAEVGKVFAQGYGATDMQQNTTGQGGEHEQQHAAALRFSASPQRHWQGTRGTPDVFQIKADLYAFLYAMGYAPGMFQVRAEAPAWFHPGRSGSLCLGKEVLASFGELHPAVQKQFGGKGTMVMFEVVLNKLLRLKNKTQSFHLSAYQAVEKDMAFIVDSHVPAGDLLTLVKRAEKDLLQQATVFDVYSGNKLPEGKKSVAVSFVLQSAERTLTDADIKQVMDKVSALAEKTFGAILRSE